MNTLGQIWQTVEDALRNRHDRDVIKRNCQMAYYELCEMQSWVGLRRKATLSANKDGETLLPADLIGLDGVWDSDGNRYWPIEQGSGQAASDLQHSFTYAEPVQSALLISSGSINSGSKNFAINDAYPESLTGEYLTLGNEPGFYRIASEATLERAYFGPKLDNKPIIIRPVGTKVLRINGGGTVNVFYWAYPEPLYEAYQRILLPHTRPLELATIIRVIGLYDRKESAVATYRQDLAQAISDMQGINPRFTGHAAPVGKNGFGIRFK